MTVTVHVKSAEGRLCLDPRTGAPIPPEGASVTADGYWRRRLAQGDAVFADPPPAPAPASKLRK